MLCSVKIQAGNRINYPAQKQWIRATKIQTTMLHRGKVVTLLLRAQLPIKEWFMRFSTHSQEKCYIRQMGGAGVISNPQCWNICKVGAITALKTYMMKKSAQEFVA